MTALDTWAITLRCPLCGRAGTATVSEDGSDGQAEPGLRIVALSSGFVVVERFAALDVASGTIIGECLGRHRAAEFLSFLKKIDRATPAHLDLHLILDNYATHKTPAVKRWLARHKRFELHFTPTSSSWLNLVERLFAEITRQRIQRGTFNNVDELKAAITDWITHRNQNPKPFNWTASAKSIIAKYRRAKKALAIAKADVNE